ncbi:hypothetical protein GCM10022243_16920 [Saccharothrix violaceirubra]|uniref:Uncharacterized protein n=1 Tax=Saccharothrix violaceirubra TaxID=413306 RepID=A0A7W7T6S7_9PSEU|nr:hypothetical protein [Saccharothrix violaceirubra]MBB4967619.1 hypothetical protein [Saccharothrix violaceirubra]
MTERQETRPLTTEDLVRDEHDRVETHDVPGDGRHDHETAYDRTPYDHEPLDEADGGDVADTHHIDVDEPAPDRSVDADAPLFTDTDADSYREQWRSLQADFVDNPREAVQRADELVAGVIQSLATTFADHKRSLEGQWQRGDQVETEELRLALHKYRSFFDRLLAV